MNNIIKMADNLPQLPRTEQVHVRADQVLVRWNGARCHGMNAADRLADFDAVLPVAQAMLKDLQAAERPASRPEIANHVIVLAGCFSSGPVSGEIYARVLSEKIDAMRPSIGDLEYTCNTMIETRTSAFQPTIGEVLAALKAAKQHYESIIRQITSITAKDRDWYVGRVEEERLEFQAAEEKRLAAEERRQRLKADQERHLQSMKEKYGADYIDF